MQGLNVQTFEDLKRTIGMPTFHHVPVGRNENDAFLIVSQEEMLYHDGNSLDDVRFGDCLPFEDLSKNCVNKCLPVIAQNFYEESVDQPKCEIGSDHFCMFNGLWKVCTFIFNKTHTVKSRHSNYMWFVSVALMVNY